MTEKESLISKFKNITSYLHKIAECPICLDTIKAPFRLCERGHGVCWSCCGGLKKCPTCEAFFVLENPVILKNLLEALPVLCSFSDNGCEEILTKGSDHDLYCGYRPIVCRQKSCNVITPLVNIMDHYIKSHPAHIFKTESFAIMWNDFDVDEKRHTYVPISLLDNLFWIFIMNDTTDKHLKLFFEATPVGKNTNEYFAQIKFEQDNFVFVSTIKATTLISCEKKYTIEEDNDVRQTFKGECMSLSLACLQNLISEDGDYQLRCEIFVFEKKF